MGYHYSPTAIRDCSAHTQFFSATRQHRRPCNAGKRPGVGTAPTINQGGQQRAPRQRTRAAPIPATWQIGRCYWIQDGTSNFQAGEIQSISQHATIWRWLHNNKNSTRANNRMHREGTTLITDQELLHLHASPFLTKFQVQARFAQGIPATTFPHIPLHSTGAIPLSLDGFWDTLNTHQWNSSLLWLERDFDPTRFLTRKPNTVAPQGTARTSFLNCLKAGTNLLIQFQSTHPDGTLQQNNRYNQMTMLLRCAPILLLQQGYFHHGRPPVRE